MSANPFDVIIIGGGINGVGVARDCCLRGFRTALIEAEDFASGATGASTGLIHGGPRYLESDIETTRHSCVDSGFIQKLAPQLLFRIPFMVPWKKGAKILPELLETFFSAYDQFTVLKNGKKHARLTRDDCFTLEPGLDSAVDGAVTFDEWGVNPFRLTYINLLDALKNGLEVFNHTEVTQLIFQNKRIVGVRGKKSDDSFVELRGQVVVNLTGPWAPKIASMAGADVQLRPSKGVHLVLDRRYTNVAVTCTGIDGRNQMFILPHENTTLIGATDDDYFGDPRHIPITEDEVQYILDAATDMIPSIRGARVVRAFAGVRPTLFRRGVYEDDLSRAHKIIDHEVEDDRPGLITMVGGKLAAFRLMSEECTDLIAKKLNSSEKCQTAQRPLPGAQDLDEIQILQLSKKYSLPEFALARIHFRHGSESETVLEQGKEKLGELSKQFACACEPVTFAELSYAVRNEQCETINDVRRRTRLGMGPCSGCGCTIHAANEIAAVSNASSEQWHHELCAFLQHRYNGRRNALFSSETMKQEEYLRHLYQLSGGITHEPPPQNILSETQ